MDISKLLNDIIPPNDHEHRNGFTNEHIIDALSPEGRVQIEAELISMLQKKTDMLIVETLSYMKSDKSLSLFYELLENPSDEMARIIIAVSIFEINQDEKLFELAKASLKKIEDKYQLISAFHYLVRFQDTEISKLIQEYTSNSDYLISYNAKQALGI